MTSATSQISGHRADTAATEPQQTGRFLTGTFEEISTGVDNDGIQFRSAPRYADGPTAQYMTHMFAMRCQAHGIEHLFTRINHLWTNGQIERINRTIKDATVRRFHYDSHDQLH